MCQGGINVHGLQGDGTLFLGRANVKGAHIMETVGKLYENNAKILGHCQEHLTQITDAGLLLGLEGNIQLGHAVYDIGNVRTKLSAHILQGNAVGAILHRIVEKSGANGICIQLTFVHDGSHSYGVDNIIFPGNTLLAAV